jgi:hypothetical protein
MAATHNFIFHHRDVRGRAAEGSRSQFEEQTA